MLLDQFLIKNLLKSVICGTHEQCTYALFTADKVNYCGLEREKKKKKQRWNADATFIAIQTVTYFQSKFCYNLQYPLLRTSWLMRQTIIFLSLFFSYYWFSYISFFFSLLQIFELFLPMMWVFEIFDKCKNLNHLIMNYELFFILFLIQIIIFIYFRALLFLFLEI